MRRLVCLAALLLLAACGGPSLTPDDVAANNRGVGLMGQFDFEAARAAFAELVTRRPEWHEAKVNLAIALLNRQSEGDPEAAMALLDQVLAADAGNLRAHYCKGLLLLHAGEAEAAVKELRLVAGADPKDAYAAYFAGQAAVQAGQADAALPLFVRAIELDPYLRSPYYASFRILMAGGRGDEAKAAMETFQRLASNPQARLAEMKYTRMGPKADALAVGVPEPARKPPAGPVFDGPKELAGGAPWRKLDADDRVSLTACDLNGDGRLDLFATGVLDPASGRSNSEPQAESREQGRRLGGAANAVLVAGTQGYTVDLDHPLAAVTDVNAALWGDVDNDGLTDVYLCRRGPNQLWRQVRRGEWEDVTAATGTANGDLDTVDGAMLDADHDGDLDLFLVNADGPDELLNNDRNGSFRPLAAERGLAGPAGSRRVVAADLDGDRDVDLVVLREHPPHRVFLNQLQWSYAPAKGLEAFCASDITAAVAVDADADGRSELYALGTDGSVKRWSASENGAWAATELLRPGEVDPGGQLALVDVDGDGTLELLVSTSRGVVARRLGKGGGELFVSGTALGVWLPVLVDPGRGPAIVGLDPAGRLLEWPAGPGRHPFLALALSGLEDQAQSLRSNASGIGARAVARADSRWIAGTAFRDVSGAGQSLQPLAFGLGGAERADFVTIDWTDGVFQTELGLASGQLHRVAETQRQMSSCPVLFAWDGSRYAFVTDVLGVGGVGYAVAAGEYAEPRPRESLLLPAGLPVAREGRLELKLTEPMEEAAYMDAARLVAFDLPPGWQVVVDERAEAGGAAPSGQALFFRRELLPARATNDRGEDVTGIVTAADLRAAPPGELDRRFIGRLAGEHVLTLAFPQPLDTLPGRALLVADGWVEYPYSQTNFAAWQAGAAYQAPVLEAQAADGRWLTLLDPLGYPAGMPRRMAVPLPPLPAGCRALRLRTNQEVYWDRLAVAFAEECPAARRLELPLAAAAVRAVGFPLRTTGPQRLPGYDYSLRAPLADTLRQAGSYSALGDVTELVAAVDDAVAIIGAGEEVHLAFTAPADGPPAGWSRRFVLEANGWCKDMDPYTRDGGTLGPLPESGSDPARRELLHARYNTRYESGR